jgi:hypothetical protein
MSVATGEQGVMAAVLSDAKSLLEAAAAVEEEQLDLLAPPSPEEMAVAREELGPEAGKLAVLRHAREKRRGRPKGSRNKRTDDFSRYLLSFGQHPAITMMQIQSTPPEALIEASKQEKVHSFSKAGEPRIVIERLSYEQAQSLRIRCAEGLMPFVESKKPVAIDMNIRGVDVVEEAPRQLTGHSVDGDYVEVAAAEDEGEEPGE